AARQIVPPELPPQHAHRSHDQDQGHELQRLLVVLKQHQLRHRAEEAKHQNEKNPPAQQLNAVGSHGIGGSLWGWGIHRSLLYGRLRASLTNSVTVTLYFAITPLTNAVTPAASGLSGISAFSISIMPFSIAT